MLRLRELQREDMPEINRWRNDPELIAGLGAPYRYINLDVDNGWYDSYLRSRGTCVRCAIVEEGTESQILGLVSLTGIDPVHQSAELHLMIGKAENRGRGLGTFAVRTMLRHAFENLNLHRVSLGVLESNSAAISLYEKVGFVREGVKRQSHYKNGKFVSMILMSILREEFSSGNS